MTAPTDEGDDGFRIVGIGASAGGLDACRHLLDALPDDHGMAMVLVQHLDPNHESMLVELLGRHTSMRVRQAVEGMAIEPDNLYVIPPGADLTVGNGALHLSRRQIQRGAHMPFDNLLQSMVVAYGAQVVCIILSGTGADGTAGAKAVRDSGGWVIAQDPEEAGYDGMPRSAITADVVDQVLAVAQIPEALARRRTHQTRSNKPEAGSPPDATAAQLAKIVALLRSRTAHDFTHYKPGTLQRRIERRMAMVGIKPTDTARYFDQLQNDQSEVDLLAKDLLINVTSFFRDSKVFDLLAENFIPELVDERSKEYPLRIWIAGCSSGEEAYSLTMLFMERIAVANPSLKLQVFASDVDADAVTLGRAGLYPATITESVSPARLERFFETEEHGYRVRPELRAAVVFTVQDVLVDPPFSRLDMVSCRNLLIYLQPDAQARAIATFHFGLREGGILLLGSSETVGAEDIRFEMIAKPERLFRRIGRNVPGAIEFPVSNAYGTRAQTLPQPGRAMTRQAGFGELCRRLVLENQAPASVLINDKAECLYLLGPVERYLRIASGHPSHDLLAMAGPGLRSKLRSAIHQASQRNARVVIAGGTITTDGRKTTFNIDVQPAPGETDTLLLVCFVETPMPEAGSPAAPPSTDPRVGELEQELAATRAELLGAIRSLEMNAERERAINEEAMSANEEFQSTNEELVTSKEELQSLNEELTALNGQLQETLERQRTTSNDLQNVLYSTDVATLFLDRDMNIRFFTPATRSLFNVIPGDVGRKLADLNALAADAELLADAQAVLDNPTPIEREIKTEIGLWFMRRVLPYRTQNGGVDGVVITFTDITERRHVAAALEAAKQQADVANVAKSRFLAAASHDLRQPLQTLVLIQGLLEKHVQAAAARDLVARLDQTLSAMSSMLNTLLDINQIEAGIVHPEPIEFPVGDMLDQLAGEFAFQAAEQGLALRMVSCNAVIRSDPQ